MNNWLQTNPNQWKIWHFWIFGCLVRPSGETIWWDRLLVSNSNINKYLGCQVWSHVCGVWPALKMPARMHTHHTHILKVFCTHTHTCDWISHTCLHECTIATHPVSNQDMLLFTKWSLWRCYNPRHALYKTCFCLRLCGIWFFSYLLSVSFSKFLIVVCFQIYWFVYWFFLK